MVANNKKWAEFDFEKVFSFKRGKRLVSLDQVNGDIAYISSTKKNNGIDNYITPPDYMMVYKNAMTLNNSGSVGYCFYHPYEFVASDHCTVINILDTSVVFNNYIALFLKPIIETMKVKYNFAREISDARLSKERIVLPINSFGNPDWEYMISFIKEISNPIIFNSKTIKQSRNKEIDFSNWSNFTLSSLFDIKKGKRLTKEDFIEGNTPFIGAIDSNNGYREFIGQEPIHEGNTITVNYNGSVAEAFYQPKPFWASDDVNVLYPKFEMNQYHALFIVSLIKLEKFRFNYGRKWNLDRMTASEIKLPVDKKGTPDFKLIENYMKKLPYTNSI